MTVLYRAPISARRSPIHGYGVFADTDIEKGSLIEECYIIILDTKNEYKNYAFSLARAGQEGRCMPLGYGGLYNHSPTPNADYYFDEAVELLVFIAVESIRKDEEICISYGKTWFSKRNLTVMRGSLWQRMKKWMRGHYHLMRALLLAIAIMMFAAVLQDWQGYLALIRDLSAEQRKKIF